MLLERDSKIARVVSSPIAVLLVVFILIATQWWVLGQVEERDRAEVGKAAETQAANLAHAFEEHVLRSVQDIDSALRLLRRTWQIRREYFDDEVAMLQQTYDKDLLLQIAVIDRDGKLAYSNLPQWTRGADLSDRQHFTVHRNTAEDNLFISKPVVGRISGRSSIQLTRRISAADGSFDGVLVVSLDPNYFSGFFATVDVGQQGAISLVRMDGTILARNSKFLSQAAKVQQGIAPSNPLMHPGTPSAGSFEAASPVDGIRRIVTYRRLDTYPLAVMVGFAVDEVFRMHDQRWSDYRRWAVELSLLLFLGGLALARALARQQRYRTELARQARQLAQGNSELLEQQQRLSFVNDSLRLLNNIATLPHATVGDKLAQALYLGRNHLKLDMGIVSHVVGTRYIVEHCSVPPEASLKAGDTFEFAETYCAITLNSGDVVAISHMGASEHAGHPCYAALKLETYIGVPLVVQGEVYGTVNFSSATPYSREFDEGDLEFMRLLGRWVGSVLDAECVNRQLRQLATTDPLTGIWNRRYFLEEAERDIERAHRYGHPLSVMMLDIDHFKRVNDSFGHHAGDETLVAFTEACGRMLRAGDVFGRLGGEEFAILLQETEAETALEVCERLRATVASVELATAKGVIRVTVSIGVAELGQGESAESLLNRADAALYQAKQEGRDRVVVADTAGRATA